MLPRVFDYTNYRLFLQERFEAEKATSQFSYSVFAQRAGLKSRSFLRLVISGRRNLTEDSIRRISTGFAFSPLENQAFASLVRYSQAKDLETRQKHWEEFLKTSSQERKSFRVRDDYMYLTRMAYPILSVLLRQEHISHDLENLSRLSGLDSEKLKEGLTTLSNLGLITEIRPGHYKASSPTCSTSDDLPNMAIRTFHKNVLSKAAESIELPTNQREFQTVLMALRPEDVAYLRARIRSWADEVDHTYSGSQKGSTQIYALNFNLIPMTPSFIQAPGLVAEEDPTGT